jgi:exonuclease VII small subunit
LEFATDQLRTVRQWTQQARAVTEGGSQYTVDKVQELIESGKGKRFLILNGIFNHHFVLAMSVYLPYLTTLNDLMETTLELEAAIATVTSGTTITGDIYEELQSRVNSNALQVANAHILDAVGQRLNFMENLESVIDKDRIPVETINQLSELASDLLENSNTMDIDDSVRQSSESVLSRALETKLKAAQARMADLVGQVAPLIEQAKPVIIAGLV